MKEITFRRVMLVVGFVLFTVLVSVLTVGVMENHALEHQYDQCQPIDTGTKFKGYNCGGHAYYIYPKQK
jgi:hypothetical protein